MPQIIEAVATKEQMTRQSALETIKKISQSQPKAFKCNLEQTPGYLEMGYQSFEKYLESSDQSRDQMHESVTHYLTMTSGYLEKAEQPSEDLVKEMVRTSGDVVMRQADTIEQIEKWKLIGRCVGWTLLGIGAGVAAAAFFGSNGRDANDKRA